MLYWACKSRASVLCLSWFSLDQKVSLPGSSFSENSNHRRHRSRRAARWTPLLLQNPSGGRRES